MAMQLAKYSGAQISIEGRSYTKTGTGPVVFIPAYKNTGGTVWHYWAVLGRSESAAAGTVNTPQYTAAYNLTVNGRPVYVLTLDNGAFETGTLIVSGMGMTYAEIPTGAEGQWYDLGSMTGENYWLKEAESMLYAYEHRARPGLMMPGGGNGKAPMELYRAERDKGKIPYCGCHRNSHKELYGPHGKLWYRHTNRYNVWGKKPRGLVGITYGICVVYK